VLPDFDLRCGDRRIATLPTAQRLIAYLALNDRRKLRRAFVSGVLWDNVPQQRANASLRSAVWRAPTYHGRPVVEASTSHVWLHADVVVDLDRSRELARLLLDGHTVDPSRVDLTKDVAALSDDVLVGWYDDWAVVERDRFRLLRLQSLEQLGDLLLCDGCPRLAARVAAAVVAAEPLRESAQRLLVRAHLDEGNLAEALRQYASYADLLRRELGLRPSPAMERLIGTAMRRGNDTTPVAQGSKR
jgi:DNA-binding SARP family transcriptional activator